MKSAGNDIVALKAIDKQRSCLPRFYSKFITLVELKLFDQHEFSQIPLEKFVWLLWSVKESAYKYLKRNNTELFFSPSKLIVEHISPIDTITNLVISDLLQFDNIFYRGIVGDGSRQLYFQSCLNDRFITSVVNDKADFNHVYWDVQLIANTDNNSQSVAVRSFTLNRLKNFLPFSDLSIKKASTGCPVLMSGNQIMDVPISFAHHDCYVAYSFLMDDDYSKLK